MLEGAGKRPPAFTPYAMQELKRAILGFIGATAAQQVIGADVDRDDHQNHGDACQSQGSDSWPIRAFGLLI